MSKLKLLAVLVLPFLMVSLADAQIAKVRVSVGTGVTQEGTAVAICQAARDHTYFLTAAHVFQQKGSTPNSTGRVQLGNAWFPVRLVYLEYDDTIDLACFELRGKVIDEQWISKVVDQGRGSVRFVGYPGESPQPITRTAKVVDKRNGSVNIPDGVYQGDSGGPVFDAENRVVGIVYGYGERHSDVKANLNLCSFLARCPPGVQCYEAPPNYRVRVRSPGYVSPPVITPPVYNPPTYDVEQLPPPAKSEALVQGPPGERGPQGKQGPQGLPGPPGLSVDASELENIKARLAQLENRKRVVAIAANGKITDQDSYSLDQPIVIDLRSALKE